MKIKLIVLIALLAITKVEARAAETSIKTDAPKEVLAAFKEKFPTAKDVEWTFLKDENQYFAEFDLKGAACEATFDKDGTWVETVLVIKQKDLPTVVMDAYNKKFPDKRLADFKKIESAANGVRYLIGYRSYPATKRVLFDDQGNYIPKEGESDEEEEETED